MISLIEKINNIKGSSLKEAFDLDKYKKLLQSKGLNKPYKPTERDLAPLNTDAKYKDLEKLLKQAFDPNYNYSDDSKVFQTNNNLHVSVLRIYSGLSDALKSKIKPIMVKKGYLK